MHCTRESNENRFSFLFAVNAAPPERAIDNIAVVHSRECDTIIYDFFTTVNIWEMTMIILSTAKYYNNRLPTYEYVAARNAIQTVNSALLKRNPFGNGFPCNR